jgi:hypothetical protein
MRCQHVALLTALAGCLVLIGCKDNQGLSSPALTDIPAYEFEHSGEDFLVSALDEVVALADWSQANPAKAFDAGLAGGSSPRYVIAKTATDTVFVYGQVTVDGYGAVVTERHTYPKGLLLITVRKSYGREAGHMVTETRRYTTDSDFQNNRPQYANITETYGLARDTIVTHVFRDGTLDTYTFRLPVVTRTVNADDGSVRVISRYASNNTIVSATTDGTGSLILLRESTGQSDGSIVTRTEYPDHSWRSTRVLGRSDGSILRENTSGK